MSNTYTASCPGQLIYLHLITKSSSFVDICLFYHHRPVRTDHCYHPPCLLNHHHEHRAPSSGSLERLFEIAQGVRHHKSPKSHNQTTQRDRKLNQAKPLVHQSTIELLQQVRQAAFQCSALHRKVRKAAPTGLLSTEYPTAGIPQTYVFSTQLLTISY
jgi:hypothetical protein